MAKGLRIHHLTERSVVLLVPIPAKHPELGGTPKDIHIHLDENGDSLISEGVWNELLRARESGLSDHEFVVLNEVYDPPTLMAGPGLDNGFNHPVIKRVMKVIDGEVKDAKLQAVAQQFAPKGVKARITTNKDEK